jgi:hypothetical protein
MKLLLDNGIKRRFADLCKDLDDDIVYLEDYDDDVKEVESESEPIEQSIVLSR